MQEKFQGFPGPYEKDHPKNHQEYPIHHAICEDALYFAGCAIITIIVIIIILIIIIPIITIIAHRIHLSFLSYREYQS